MAQVWKETINVNEISWRGFNLANMAWRGLDQYRPPVIYITDDQEVLNLARTQFLQWFETEGDNSLILHTVGGMDIKGQINNMLEVKDVADVNKMTRRLREAREASSTARNHAMQVKPEVLVYSAYDRQQAGHDNGTQLLAAWAFSCLPAAIFLSNVELYYPLIDSVRHKVPGEANVLGSVVKVNK